MEDKTPSLTLPDYLEYFWELFSEISFGFQRFDANGNAIRLDWEAIQAWQSLQGDVATLTKTEQTMLLVTDASYVSELQKEIELFRVRAQEKGKSK